MMRRGLLVQKLVHSQPDQLTFRDSGAPGGGRESFLLGLCEVNLRASKRLMDLHDVQIVHSTRAVASASTNGTLALNLLEQLAVCSRANERIKPI